MARNLRRQPSQLAQLIWNFYRENGDEQSQLRSLAHCQVFRRWGVLHVRCESPEAAQAMLAAQSLLSLPIAKLRIAHHMRILLHQELLADVPIEFDQQLA